LERNADWKSAVSPIGNRIGNWRAFGGSAEKNSAIQHSAAKPATNCGMEFRVYTAIAHNLGNVTKSRVNAELHAYASPIQSPLKILAK
jgi:hypothetical protein